MTASNVQAMWSLTIKAYEDRIAAQTREAKAKLEQFEAMAMDKSAQEEIAAIKRLNTAKQNINRKLQDLKTTHESNVARAKADIDADVATFKASVDEFAAKLKAQSEKK